MLVNLNFKTKIHMKKLHILITALYVITCTQFISAQSISIGPRVGFGLSSYMGDHGIDDATLDFLGAEASSEFVLGYYVGATANISLSDKFSLQPEILYAAQGGALKLTFTGDGDNEEASITTIFKIGYLKIPVLAKYYVVGEAGNGLGLFLGPHVGLKISEGGTLEDSEGNTEDFEEDDFKGLNEDGEEVDVFNGLDVGLIVGANYEFDFGLSVGLRYDLGFLGAFNTDAGDSEDTTYKNSAISLSLAYMFKLSE